MDADVAAAAQMLKMPGAALMIDGRALYGEQRLIAARIAKATGCRLMCPFLVSRVHRGVGSLLGNRMAYRLAENMPVLSETSAIVLCGADRPVTFFAYPGKQILPEPPNCRIFELCGPEMDYIGTLEALADNVGTGHIHVGPERFATAGPSISSHRHIECGKGRPSHRRPHAGKLHRRGRSRFVVPARCGCHHGREAA